MGGRSIDDSVNAVVRNPEPGLLRESLKAKLHRKLSIYSLYVKGYIACAYGPCLFDTFSQIECGLLAGKFNFI